MAAKMILLKIQTMTTTASLTILMNVNLAKVDGIHRRVPITTLMVAVMRLKTSMTITMESKI